MSEYQPGSIGDLLTRALHKENIKQRRLATMRILAIWISGLAASGIFGSTVGYALAGDMGGFWGFLAGALAFTCFRLWTAEKPQKMPVYDLKDDRLE